MFLPVKKKKELIVPISSKLHVINLNRFEFSKKVKYDTPPIHVNSAGLFSLCKIIISVEDMDHYNRMAHGME